MGKVRIIGGQWRGRLLDVADHRGLRPTPDRVRETLFNWLQCQVPGARCLDVFAGSGALGFEAASREAKSVVMLEKERPVASALKAQAKRLGGPIEVMHADALKWLPTVHGQPFDLVFLDPPFDAGLLPRVLSLLATPGRLATDAHIYMEFSSRSETPPLPEGWRLMKRKTLGEVTFALLQAR